MMNVYQQALFCSLFFSYIHARYLVGPDFLKKRRGLSSDVFIVSNKANIRIHHDGDRFKVRQRSRTLDDVRPSLSIGKDVDRKRTKSSSDVAVVDLARQDVSMPRDNPDQNPNTPPDTINQVVNGGGGEFLGDTGNDGQNLDGPTIDIVAQSQPENTVQSPMSNDVSPSGGSVPQQDPIQVEENLQNRIQQGDVLVSRKDTPSGGGQVEADQNQIQSSTNDGSIGSGVDQVNQNPGFTFTLSEEPINSNQNKINPREPFTSNQNRVNPMEPPNNNQINQDVVLSEQTVGGADGRVEFIGQGQTNANVGDGFTTTTVSQLGESGMQNEEGAAAGGNQKLQENEENFGTDGGGITPNDIPNENAGVTPTDFPPNGVRSTPSTSQDPNADGGISGEEDPNENIGFDQRSTTSAPEIRENTDFGIDREPQERENPLGNEGFPQGGASGEPSQARRPIRRPVLSHDGGSGEMSRRQIRRRRLHGTMGTRRSQGTESGEDNGFISPKRIYIKQKYRRRGDRWSDEEWDSSSWESDSWENDYKYKSDKRQVYYVDDTNSLTVVPQEDTRKNNRRRKEQNRWDDSDSSDWESDNWEQNYKRGDKNKQNNSQTDVEGTNNNSQNQRSESVDDERRPNKKVYDSDFIPRNIKSGLNRRKSDDSGYWESSDSSDWFESDSDESYGHREKMKRPSTRDERKLIVVSEDKSRRPSRREIVRYRSDSDSDDSWESYGWESSEDFDSRPSRSQRKRISNNKNVERKYRNKQPSKKHEYESDFWDSSDSDSWEDRNSIGSRSKYEIRNTLKQTEKTNEENNDEFERKGPYRENGYWDSDSSSWEDSSEFDSMSRSYERKSSKTKDSGNKMYKYTPEIRSSEYEGDSWETDSDSWEYFDDFDSDSSSLRKNKLYRSKGYNSGETRLSGYETDSMRNKSQAYRVVGRVVLHKSPARF